MGDGGADVVLRPVSDQPAQGVICQCKYRGLGEGSVYEAAVEEVIRIRPYMFPAVPGWVTRRLLR